MKLLSRVEGRGGCWKRLIDFRQSFTYPLLAPLTQEYICAWIMWLCRCYCCNLWPIENGRLKMSNCVPSNISPSSAAVKVKPLKENLGVTVGQIFYDHVILMHPWCILLIPTVKFGSNLKSCWKCWKCHDWMNLYRESSWKCPGNVNFLRSIGLGLHWCRCLWSWTNTHSMKLPLVSSSVL